MLFWLNQFLIFSRKQAYSALFGGVLLFFIMLTKFVTIPGIYRYDLLFIIAIITQVVLVTLKLETKKEVIFILIFHLLAMCMEIFKVYIGSWIYPSKAILSIYGVPLFTGFMYSAIGSYMVRAWKINEFRFVDLPKQPYLLLLGLLIYLNFFSNHYIVDLRYFMFIFAIILFWKTKFYVKITDRIIQIHPLLANALTAFVIWMSEQVGTFARIWLYPHQEYAWRPVGLHMFTSWYMLLILSFAIVASLMRTESNK